MNHAVEHPIPDTVQPVSINTEPGISIMDPTPSPAPSGTGILSIDLSAICENWRFLKAQGAGNTHNECAAVVKADAYGLGADQVASALFAAGCRHFFVAHLEEGLSLRRKLPAAASIFILHGPPPGGEALLQQHQLTPVLNSLAQLSAWQKLAAQQGKPLDAILQVDTGMARLGLSSDEQDYVARRREDFSSIHIGYLMSHLASAEDQGNPTNERQLARFLEARKKIPTPKATFANSSGVFLGQPYHFDLLRPGAALYGVAPVMGQANPMRPVVRLQAQIIQTRRVEAHTPVGYGGTWTTPRKSILATIAIGYADGYLRSISHRGKVRINGFAVPLVGNISMDTLIADITDLPDVESLLPILPGTWADLLDSTLGVDEVGSLAGSIGYEILTSLGQRYQRRYLRE